MKITLASSNMGLRPKMSLTLPHDGIEAAFASRMVPCSTDQGANEQSREILSSFVDDPGDELGWE